jgi:hypothetical protein
MVVVEEEEMKVANALKVLPGMTQVTTFSIVDIGARNSNHVLSTHIYWEDCCRHIEDIQRLKCRLPRW